MEKRQRLQKLIDYYTNGNKRQFAKLVGTSPQNINTWMARDTFDSDLILTKCEHINADWLMTGRGDMLRDNTSEPAVETKSEEAPDDYKKIVNDLLAVINIQATQFNQLSNDLHATLETVNRLLNSRASSYMVAEDGPCNI